MAQVDRCDLCECKAPGHYYKFFYGSILNREAYPYDDGVEYGLKTTTTYSIVGESSAFLCKSCVRKDKLLIGLKGLGWFACFACLTILCAWMDEHAHELFGIGAFLFLILAVISLVVFSLDILYAANNLAVKAKKEEYEAKGYSELFTPRQYKQLKPTSR